MHAHTHVYMYMYILIAHRQHTDSTLHVYVHIRAESTGREVVEGADFKSEVHTTCAHISIHVKVVNR